MFSAISFRARRLWHSANAAAEKQPKSIENDPQIHQNRSQNPLKIPNASQTRFFQFFIDFWNPWGLPKSSQNRQNPWNLFKFNPKVLSQPTWSYFIAVSFTDVHGRHYVHWQTVKYVHAIAKWIDWTMNSPFAKPEEKRGLAAMLLTMAKRIVYVVQMEAETTTRCFVLSCRYENARSPDTDTS